MGSDASENKSRSERSAHQIDPRGSVNEDMSYANSAGAVRPSYVEPYAPLRELAPLIATSVAAVATLAVAYAIASEGAVVMITPAGKVIAIGKATRLLLKLQGESRGL